MNGTAFSGRKAAFFDRDGTVIVDKGYAFRPEEIEILPGMPEFMAQMRRWDYLLVCVTNQSGIARGLYGMEDMKRFNQALNGMLAQSGAAFDAVYACPHHPKFTGPCSCRKPAPGMLLQAQKDLGLDLSRCLLFGDTPSDAQAAEAAGVLPVLVDGRPPLLSPQEMVSESACLAALRRISAQQKKIKKDEEEDPLASAASPR